MAEMRLIDADRLDKPIYAEEDNITGSGMSYDTDECPMCFLIEGEYYEYTNGNGFCDRGEREEGADNG